MRRRHSPIGDVKTSSSRRHSPSPDVSSVSSYFFSKIKHFNFFKESTKCLSC